MDIDVFFLVCPWSFLRRYYPNIWLDEHETASLKSINITELSTQDLEFLDSYDKPTCLAIKK